MLLDEPFANVDVTLRRALREDARRALRRSGSIAVVVTHDPDEALELADCVAVLDGGRVVQAGQSQRRFGARQPTLRSRSCSARPSICAAPVEKGMR